MTRIINWLRPSIPTHLAVIAKPSN